MSLNSIFTALSIGALLVACGDGGTGGSGGASGGGNTGGAPLGGDPGTGGDPSNGGAPLGGNPGNGGAPAGDCFLDPQCPNADLATCTCNGCDPLGCYDPEADPPIASDCTCPICDDDPLCGCDDDGVCDPFLENCACADCAAYC